MYKLWITTVLDGKITNNIIIEWNEKGSVEKALSSALDSACYQLDLSKPIIMKKHISEINNFNRTKFLPEHFIESVDFDKMDLEVFESDKKPKNNPKYY